MSPAKPPVSLLVAATATGPLALNVFVPSMPALPAAFGTGHATVQLTLSLYLVGVAVGQLAYGPLSDRFGRRPVLLGGMGLYVLASLACALAPSIGLLILGRIAQAMGGCAGMVIGRAVVRDAWERDEATRVLALVIAGMAVAPMVGPVLGGFLDEWAGWRAGFVLLVGFGAVVLLAGLRALPETHRDRTPFPGPMALLLAYRSLAAKPVYIGNALATSMATASFFAFLSGAPHTMVELLGRTPSEYGLWFVLLSVGYMAGNVAVTRIAHRVDPESLVWTGLAMSVAGPVALLGFLLAGMFTPATLFVPMLLMSFGNGLSFPPAMTMAIGAEPRLAGTASGLLGFLQMGFGAVAAAAVGAMKAWEPMVMVLAMVAFNLLALAAAHYARRRPHPRTA
ncbi:multidrug effflux MFS transporter [Azospirillum sp.]|uniref:multidrug effflux MFS transporter n=1 Tax=Azospirillum sp. TaxID=34012 RepID=UPI002D31C67B|nr:multidrug effflux MFS transporter [Azospirillum sp.]HYD65964.1 multidrug effflux MFS transporter [Azospirillum sp.]